MKTDSKTPSLTEDIATIGGLYRNVAWMIAQRVRHGPHWQERLTEEELGFAEEHEPELEPVTPGRHRAA